MKYTTFFLSLCMIVSTGFAQLVNIENQRKNNKAGLQGQVSLALDLKQNTKTIMQANNGVSLQYTKVNNTFIVLNDLSFLKINEDEPLVNSGFQHIRYNYTFPALDSRITAEAFIQHQYNHVKLLERRFLLGGGPRVRVLGSDSTSFYIYLSPLVMYEAETLFDSDKDLNPSELEAKRMKGDFYISAGYRSEGIFSLNHVTYFQPYFKDFSDFRVASKTELTFKVNDKISFGIEYSLDFDSKPPTTITGEEKLPKMFYSLSNKIKYTF